MEEILSSIIDAERVADETLATAREEAMTITADAQKRVLEIVAESERNLKAIRRRALEDADKIATASYNDAIIRGEQDAKDILARADENIDAISDMIIEEIFG